MTHVDYDEFALFHENIDEWDLHVSAPHVERFFVAVDGLRQLSGLRWGEGPAELVLVHGGAQNAHTFDTVALALERPLLALDLPGHGHSDASPYPHSAIVSHARDLARALDQLVSEPLPLVGMSLGGLSSILVAAEWPDLVKSLTLVDITPGVNADKARHITDFVNGPKTFDNFEALLARTVEHNPTRSITSLRRGILHNAIQRADGTWIWRHQQHAPSPLSAPDAGDLWATIGALTMPVILLRAMGPGSVVDDEDEAKLLEVAPESRVVHVANSGHSIQGDQPLEMAVLLERLVLD